MQFKELKQGYPIYVLDKQNLTVSPGQITKTGPIHLETDPKTGKNTQVLDITVEIGGKTVIYTVPEGASITYTTTLAIAADTQSLSNELEAMINLAELIIAAAPQQEQIKIKATALLSDYNPIYKERAKAELRYNALEEAVRATLESVKKLEGMVEALVTKMN